MRIAIEGPELSTVDFTEILAVFSEKKHCTDVALKIVKNSEGEGDSSAPPPPPPLFYLSKW